MLTSAWHTHLDSELKKNFTRSFALATPLARYNIYSNILLNKVILKVVTYLKLHLLSTCLSVFFLFL